MLTCQISSRSVYSVALRWRKSLIFAIFCTLAFSVVADWPQSDKVENGCATTNSNAFMAKSGAQSLTLKSVTNKQTDRQTNKKNSTFLATRRHVKSEPHQSLVGLGFHVPPGGQKRGDQTWHGDRGPTARLCSSKTFWGFYAQFHR